MFHVTAAAAATQYVTCMLLPQQQRSFATRACGRHCIFAMYTVFEMHSTEKNQVREHVYLSSGVYDYARRCAGTQVHIPETTPETIM
jgi:hypothetical protein